MPKDELEKTSSARSVPKAWHAGGDTHEHRFREGEDFVLGQEPVLILIMDVEKPFDVVH